MQMPVVLHDEVLVVRLHGNVLTQAEPGTLPACSLAQIAFRPHLEPGQRAEAAFR